VRQLEPVHQLRIETWDGKPGDSVNNEHANIVEPDRRGLGRFESHLLQQLQRMTLEDGGTRFPAMTLVIPIRRLAGVAGLDPRIAIEAFEPREMRKNALRALGNLGLADFVRRHGCDDRRDLNVEFGLLAFGPAAPGSRMCTPDWSQCSLKSEEHADQ
jgi:hypothetical protein